MEGLSTLTRLNIVDLSNNRITKIEGLEGLTLLEDLWLNDNQVCGEGGRESFGSELL